MFTSVKKKLVIYLVSEIYNLVEKSFLEYKVDKYVKSVKRWIIINFDIYVWLCINEIIEEEK